MIRKFNYTKREKILRKSVRIALAHDHNGVLAFSTDLSLDQYGLPPGASVYIEAYHGVVSQRFSFGTVSHFHIPMDRALHGFASADAVRFRVKVVDESKHHGRIVAGADGISPLSPEDTEANRVSLLHVILDEELEERLWKLDFSGDWPALRVNKHVPDMKALVRADLHFLSLVFPEIIAQVLRQILLVEEYDDPFALDQNSEQDDDWRGLWLRYALSMPGISGDIPSEEADRPAWVDDCVQAFCSMHSAMRKYIVATGADES
ncbi:MAG: hypothetical protein HQ523_03080 [Lentisphaerae bacterium]|nr:hypothetical protein [Lentisphaerota bacterium]